MLYEVITMHQAGSLDVPAVEKASHFVSMCDAFGLPLIYLIDTPGFQVGPDAERTGLARRSANIRITSYNVCYTKLLRIIDENDGTGHQLCVIAHGADHLARRHRPAVLSVGQRS